MRRRTLTVCTWQENIVSFPQRHIFPQLNTSIHGTDWRPIWMPGEQGSFAFLRFKIPIYGFRRISVSWQILFLTRRVGYREDMFILLGC